MELLLELLQRLMMVFLRPHVKRDPDEKGISVAFVLSAPLGPNSSARSLVLLLGYNNVVLYRYTRNVTTPDDSFGSAAVMKSQYYMLRELVVDLATAGVIHTRDNVGMFVKMQEMGEMPKSAFQQARMPEPTNYATQYLTLPTNGPQTTNDA